MNEAIKAQIKYYSGLYRKRMNNKSIIESIIDEVCFETDINKDVVFMRTRKREIITARQMIQHFIKEKTKLSLSKIGQLTGGFDHSTVIYSWKEVNNLKANKDYNETYEQIANKLSWITQK